VETTFRPQTINTCKRTRQRHFLRLRIFRSCPAFSELDNNSPSFLIHCAIHSLAPLNHSFHLLDLALIETGLGLLLELSTFSRHSRLRRHVRYLRGRQLIPAPDTKYHRLLPLGPLQARTNASHPVTERHPCIEGQLVMPTLARKNNWA